MLVNLIIYNWSYVVKNWNSKSSLIHQDVYFWVYHPRCWLHVQWLMLPVIVGQGMSEPFCVCCVPISCGIPLFLSKSPTFNPTCLRWNWVFPWSTPHFPHPRPELHGLRHGHVDLLRLSRVPWDGAVNLGNRWKKTWDFHGNTWDFTATKFQTDPKSMIRWLQMITTCLNPNCAWAASPFVDDWTVKPPLYPLTNLL